jgi:ribosome modulation factor
MLGGSEGSVLQEAAEAEGADAYLRGLRIRNCPYYSTSVAGKHWLAGWLEACMELRNSDASGDWVSRTLQ